MAKVLEEVTEPNIDRAHITRRVNDWADRIDRLYTQLEQWLPQGWTADRASTVRMHEQLMQDFGIGPRELPVLRLSHQSRSVARIEPRALWIIGANGRLDLFRGNDQFIIVDTAENLEPSNWRIAPLSNRNRLLPLDRQTFVAVL